MNESTPQAQKPGLVTAIAVMTLVSGIINLFWGFVASATALGTIVGVICLPIAILPTILGVFEIIYAAKLLSTQPQPVQPSMSIAVLEILTFLMGNVFSMVVGILVAIFYNDLSVKAYFSGINPVVKPTPPAPVQDIPILEEQSDPPVIPDLETAPEPVEEPPAKPKRTRKPSTK